MDYHLTHQRNVAKYEIKRLLFEAESWRYFWARSPAVTTICLCDLGKVIPLMFCPHFIIFRG